MIMAHAGIATIQSRIEYAWQMETQCTGRMNILTCADAVSVCVRSVAVEPLYTHTVNSLLLLLVNDHAQIERQKLSSHAAYDGFSYMEREPQMISTHINWPAPCNEKQLFTHPLHSTFAGRQGFFYFLFRIRTVRKFCLP